MPSLHPAGRYARWEGGLGADVFINTNYINHVGKRLGNRRIYSGRNRSHASARSRLAARRLNRAHRLDAGRTENRTGSIIYNVIHIEGAVGEARQTPATGQLTQLNEARQREARSAP